MAFSEERRIVTQRLHDRPDDSWTIDGALASGAYEVLRATLAKGDPADVQEQVPCTSAVVTPVSSAISFIASGDNHAF